MYRWAKLKDKWYVVKVNGEHFSIYGILTQFSCKDVAEWGHVVLSPSDIERLKTIYVVEPRDLKTDNAAEHELIGKRYICPEFTIYSQRQNDCGVVAVANVLGLSYFQAKLECFHCGWTSSVGITIGFCELLVEKHNFVACYRKDLSKGFVQDFRGEGTFFVRIPDHVMPARNNLVFNSKGCENLPILEVWEIRKK